MKTIGTIALALVGLGLVTTTADAGKKKSKKKTRAAAVVEAEAPRRFTDSLGPGVKLATPTGVVKKTIVIEEGALLAGADAFDLSTVRAADLPSGDDQMRLEGVRLTAADAGEVVKGNWDDIDYCWSRVPAKLRDSGVETSLQFTVDPRGKVLAVSVDGETPGRFATCMKVAAKRWNFPVADGESVVEYPLSLH